MFTVQFVTNRIDVERKGFPQSGDEKNQRFGKYIFTRINMLYIPAAEIKLFDKHYTTVFSRNSIYGCYK